jgi:hypothetical protein
MDSRKQDPAVTLNGFSSITNYAMQGIYISTYDGVAAKLTAKHVNTKKGGSR